MNITPIILIILISLYIIEKIFNNNNKIKKDKPLILYDGMRLRETALHGNEWEEIKVDCKHHFVECNDNYDCLRRCQTLFSFNDIKLNAFCVNGLCQYTDLSTSPSLCKNGSILTKEFFSLGRKMVKCICPTNDYIGRFCDIENKMKPMSNDNFKMMYINK